MNRRALMVGGMLLLVLVLCASAFYVAENPESRTLDDAARKTATGSFVRLSDGVTHYQIDGPGTGRAIVLAHGFSVPLYIWEASAFVGPNRFPDWADKYRVQMQYKGFGHALWSSRMFRRGMNTDTMYQRVAAANIPVLLIWGMQDHTVPFANNTLVRKAIPSA